MKLSDLAAELQSVEALVSASAEKDKEIARLRKELSYKKKDIKRLEWKVSVLEQKFEGLDPLDEQFLWDCQAEIKFNRRLDGTRRLYLKPAGKVRYYGDSLREIVDKASARTRGRQEQQEDA